MRLIKFYILTAMFLFFISCKTIIYVKIVCNGNAYVPLNKNIEIIFDNTYPNEILRSNNFHSAIKEISKKYHVKHGSILIFPVLTDTINNSGGIYAYDLHKDGGMSHRYAVTERNPYGVIILNKSMFVLDDDTVVNKKIIQENEQFLNEQFKDEWEK